MDQAKKLRDRIEAAPRNGRGRREYGAELRDELIAFVRERIAAGSSASAAAKELELYPATVIGWLAKEVGDVDEARMRRVDAVSKAKASGGGLVLELGDGACIRGLQIEDVLELLRALR